MTMYIDFGTHRIQFNVRFDSKEWFRVSVDSDGTVQVVAPEGKPYAAIVERVLRKAPWIIRQKNYFEQLRPKAVIRSFVSGETHYYLGRQYRLKIIQNAGKPQVQLKEKIFEISLSDCSDTKKIEGLLRKWYREQARRYYQEQITKALKKIKQHEIESPALVVRTMQRRWGSCTKGGKILLNLELIKAPSDCIEYVIMHELCHLIERNHTEKFYRLLDSLMPNWNRIKEKLEKFRLDFQK